MIEHDFTSFGEWLRLASHKKIMQANKEISGKAALATWAVPSLIEEQGAHMPLCERGNR
ncbi:hypothetical protein [Taibaiella koreensis]|uniref:hypothetical protein n=1 Tax=Taibaiella koreensis TaxID=1268548 RepID=UPI0013C2A26C|nr:hypothetical protein [Taibaiella koreensis]